MTPPKREIPKQIADFGEKQFLETGAAAVEVLRVKASTIRKHFRKLAGAIYLVGVVSLDRVRIYFFNQAGSMLIAENVDGEKYQQIRKSSRLLAKFEKPIPPTPEELRMEATEELRNSMTRGIKQVARFLAHSEPKFPTLFVTRKSSDLVGQSFGIEHPEDGSFVFEDSSLNKKWSDGLILRAGFLSLLGQQHRLSQLSHCVGNAVAYSLLKGEKRQSWLEIWLKNSQDSGLMSITNHFVKHASTYAEGGYSKILLLLQRVVDANKDGSWEKALQTVHDGIDVNLGTKDYHSFTRFCRSLEKPRKLAEQQFPLEALHLAPRVICDPTALGIVPSILDNRDPIESHWLRVDYLSGSEHRALVVSEGPGEKIESLEYLLNLEDVFPKSGGILSHGRDILRWALAQIGIVDPRENTFETKIEFRPREINNPDKAVLERLAQGSLTILRNSLIGSPQRVGSLVDSGHIVFLPDFAHLGIKPCFLARGPVEEVRTVVRNATIETTMIIGSKKTYAIVSTPSSWRDAFVQSCAQNGLSLWPIVRVESVKGWIRDEDIFPIGHNN